MLEPTVCRAGSGTESISYARPCQSAFGKDLHSDAVSGARDQVSGEKVCECWYNSIPHSFKMFRQLTSSHGASLQTQGGGEEMIFCYFQKEL